MTESCSNFAPESGVVTATNAAGDQPVCVTLSPLASALYGQRSQCELDGLADIRIEDEIERRGTRGTMMLVGPPCPGGPCSVGVELGLDVDDVKFDTFFAEANFVQLSTVGQSAAGRSLSLNAAGEGTLPPGYIDASNHGMRLPEDDDEDPVTLAYTQRNTSTFPVTVDWSSNACSIDGSLSVASAGFEVSFVDIVTGTIMNQPPTANAGTDQLDVECNVAGGGARILLDGTNSSDPDGNGDLASIRWFGGSRSGPEVGYALKAVVSQTGLGTNGNWVLRVVDGGGQSDEDTVTARVVDSTAPTVLCNTPATITPPDAEHPAVFTATASDVCAGTLTPTLANPTCYYLNKAGKRVIRDECAVTIAGATVTISNSGGVGDFISWTASASDGNGNSDAETCTVRVVRRQ
ncbi:MAG: hypothetical protein HY901_00220 [Deltaproteobacteria bacterium]|nr:hypothetical protein [Deltaproteobacteria bacterium]